MVASGASNHTPSWANFITATPELEFSVLVGPLNFRSLASCRMRFGIPGSGVAHIIFLQLRIR
jgi:hypothetical protein